MNQPQVPSQDDWSLRHADKVAYGPYPFEALVQAAQQGRIVQDTELSHPTLTSGQWVPATSIPAIQMALPDARSTVNAVPQPSPTVVVADSQASTSSAAHELRSRRQRERKRSTWGTLRFVVSLVAIAAPMILIYQTPLVQNAFVSQAPAKQKQPLPSAPPSDPPGIKEPHPQSIPPRESTLNPQPAAVAAAPASRSNRTQDATQGLPTQGNMPRQDSVGVQQPQREIRPTTIEPRSLAGFGRSEPGSPYSSALPDEFDVRIDLRTTDSKLPLSSAFRPHQIEVEDLTSDLTPAIWKVIDGSVTPKRDTLLTLQAFATHKFGLNLTCRIRLSEPVENKNSSLVCDWTWQPRQNGPQVPFSLKEMMNVRDQISEQIASAISQINNMTQQQLQVKNFIHAPGTRTLDVQKKAEQRHAMLKKNISTLQKQKYQVEHVLRDFDSFAKYAKEIGDRGQLEIRVVK